MNRRKAVFRISTGCSEFDNILGGGFESQSISECFGEFRTGKTQLAHTLCVTVRFQYKHNVENYFGYIYNYIYILVQAQMPGIGHGGGKVAYIDTESTFRK